MAKFNKVVNFDFPDVSEGEKLYSKSASRVGSCYIGEERLGEELFPEGGFEGEKVNLIFYKGWLHEGMPTPIKISFDKNVKHSGNFSLRLEKKKIGRYDCVEINDGWVEIPLPDLKPDKLYRFSLWMRTDGRGVKAAVNWPMEPPFVYHASRWRSWYDPNPRYPVEMGGTLSSDWVYVQKDIRIRDIKRDSPEWRFRLYIAGAQKGSVWFDDISIRGIKEKGEISYGSTVLEDFESGKIDALSPSNYYCPLPGYGPSSKIIKNGKYSFKLSYKFEGKKSRIDLLPIDAYFEKSNWVYPFKKLTLWIYGDGKGVRIYPTRDLRKLNTHYGEGHGEGEGPEMYPKHALTKPSDAVIVDWKGWKKVAFDCSELNWGGWRWWSLLLENPDEKEREGTIHLAQIMQEGATLRSEEYFSINIVDKNSLSVYRPKEEVSLSIKVRNNTEKEKRDIKVKYRVEDFWKKVVKEEEKEIKIISSETQIEAFAASFTPKKKGIYYTVVEVENEGVLYWKEQSFAVIEPNRPAPAPEKGGMYFNGAEKGSFYPGEIRTIYLASLLGINAFPGSWSVSWTGNDDPYRFDYWDKKSKLFKKVGISTFWEYGEHYGEIVQSIKKDKDGRKILSRLEEIKYWLMFGEVDPPDPKYTKDKEKREEYLKRIKEIPEMMKKAVKGLKELSPSAKVSPFWFMWSNSDKTRLYIIDWLKQLKGYADFFGFLVCMPRENIWYREKVRKLFFKKAGINLPVWVMASRGAVETIFPLAYSWGYESVGMEGEGFVGYYGSGYAILRGHLCDVYGYPNYEYVFLNTIIKMLSGSERKGVFGLGKSIHCCRYKKEKWIYYLWSEWIEGEDVQLRCNSKKIYIKDIMDNKKILKVKNSILNLKVSYEPIQLIVNEEINWKREIG